jgi:hypothetical protein
MIFEELIKGNKEAFIAKVEEISNYLGIIPEWLMFVMWFETARTLDHRKVNYQHGDNTDPSVRCRFRATGLIQFMPSTARYLKTTNTDLYNMSNVQQLEYVKKYLAVYRGKYKSFVDLYLAVFYPAAIGQPDTFTITSDIIARQNPVFDINKDLDITKAEIRQRLFSMIPAEYKQYF